MQPKTNVAQSTGISLPPFLKSLKGIPEKQVFSSSDDINEALKEAD
jgi:hypothetical protein